MPHTPEQNKAIVREFYDLAFNQRQPEAAVAKHVGGMYRQHNPMAGDGPGPFISFVKWFTGETRRCGSTSSDSLQMAIWWPFTAICGYHRRREEPRLWTSFVWRTARLWSTGTCCRKYPETAENQNTMF